MKDGLSSMAWSKLVETDSAERDKRVLEAYKLSQVRACECECECEMPPLHRLNVSVGTKCIYPSPTHGRYVNLSPKSTLKPCCTASHGYPDDQFY